MADLRRIAVVDRGPSAVRLIRAVAEDAAERGLGVDTVVLHPDDDRHTRWVRDGTATVSLGPASSVDPVDGRRRSAYDDRGRLEQALAEAGADGLWIGPGAPVDGEALASAAERLGMVVIGASADLRRRLADPAALATAADRAGLAVADGAAGRQGRRIAVPVARDAEGRTWALGAVTVEVGAGPSPTDRALVVGSAPTGTDGGAPAVAIAAASALADALDVVGAVTVGVDLADDGVPSVTGVVAHPSPVPVVTELATGVDPVKLALRLAAGHELEGPGPASHGFSLAVQVRAEDPERGFVDRPGPARLVRMSTGPGVRVDVAVADDDEVAPGLEPVIAEVAACGHTRDEARVRLARALRRSVAVVGGAPADLSFLIGLLEHPDVAAGAVGSGWLDDLVRAGGHVRHDHEDVALVLAAVEAYDAEGAVEQARFYASAFRGRPEVVPQAERVVRLHHRGHSYDLRVSRRGPDRYLVADAESRVHLTLERLGAEERRVTIGDRARRARTVVDGAHHLVVVDGITHAFRREDGGMVRAPAPAVIVSIAVAPGDRVAPGDPLVVVESMKMESAITAEAEGWVQAVLVTEKTQVDTGAPLLQIEGLPGGEALRPTRSPVQLPAEGRPPVPSSDAARCATAFDELHAQLLGYDTSPAERTASLHELIDACAALDATDRLVLAEESHFLGLFADLCGLSRRDPDPDTIDGGAARSARDYLVEFLRSPDRAAEQLPDGFRERLLRALSHYGVTSLDRSPALEEALLWMYKAHLTLAESAPAVTALLDRRLAHLDELRAELAGDFRALLDRLVDATENRFDEVTELAREVRYATFDRPLLDQARDRVYAEMGGLLDELAVHPDGPGREALLARLVECPQPLAGLLLRRFGGPGEVLSPILLEVLIRRFYRIRDLEHLAHVWFDEHPAVEVEYDFEDRRVHLVAAYGDGRELAGLVDGITRDLRGVPDDRTIVVELYVRWPEALPDPDVTEREVAARLADVDLGRPLRRLDVVVLDPTDGPGGPATQYLTYRPAPDGAGGLVEEPRYRGLHPMLGKRNDLWRLERFDVRRLPSAEDVYLFHGVARDNPKDERLFALAEVRDLTPVLADDGRVVALPDLERMFLECVASIRHVQSHRPAGRRLFWNQIVLYARPPWTVPADDWAGLARRLTPATRGLGLEKTTIRIRPVTPIDVPGADAARTSDREIVVGAVSGGTTMRVVVPSDEPIEPLTPYRQTVVKMQRRGDVYPYELVRMITPAPDEASAFPTGTFVEHDLDGAGELVPVDRPPGGNQANLVVGVIRNHTGKHPEGMARVAILGDPSRSLGSLAEAECRRIIGALDLAERMRVPVEWFALSSGARISMTSGTENMDWISAVLRRIIEFTQAGGEINVVVTGINVGAQPYWNAEATMLMHTRGILVMMPQSAMVLTGKQALDFSGGVSAEDNLGIGGFDRVMGRNGQAQYFAPDLTAACDLLFRHYDHTYVAPGERFPRRADTDDPYDRDVRSHPHPAIEGSDLRFVGDIFSDEHNPERKKPFAMRAVMRAVADVDREPLERWRDMVDAETVIVWDAHVGGIPVAMIGIEAHAVPRRGFLPADGPSAWTSGTFFPMSSKKTARAVNAASGNRPLVVMANLSGFDGSPESMRRLQLEFGAEIGRAVTNFRGPVVFCVVSRYHGGAFVVFSKALNEQVEIAAVEGSRASVIGGAPAAAVVFAREVDRRCDTDPRVVDLTERRAAATGAEAQRLALELSRLRDEVHSEKMGEVAAEFDAIHSVERAREVGSVDRIIPAATLRPYVIDALERGMARDAAVAPPVGGRSVGDPSVGGSS
jgi:acetyl/propionyl-CoA carboxylase alpha subunit/acetyl-CoA carboxylase carboxyltransferase component